MTLSKYQQLDSDTVAKLSFRDSQGEIFTIDIQEELSMSEATFSDDLVKQPARYAWWGTVLSQTKEKLRESEDNMTFIRAQASNEARKVLGKPTVKAVDDFVESEDQYREAKEDYLWWSGRVDMIQYVVRAYEQRMNALVQLGAQLRHQLDNASNL